MAMIRVHTHEQASRNFRRAAAIGIFLATGFASVVTVTSLLSTIQCDGYFIGANCINDPAALGAGFADNN